MTSLEAQARAAFSFVERLYFEISYLIKELEGQLQQEEEEFVIGRPSGYAVQTRTSSGLDPANVELWFPKTFTVFFVPNSLTELRQGQTITAFREDLRILLVHIEVMGKHIHHPRLLAGCLWNIRPLRSNQKKFEHLMWEFANNPQKIFASLPRLSYQDNHASFEGEFIEKPLFTIDDSQTLADEVIAPMLRIYRRGSGLP